jgi:predicted ferric reductase
MQKYKIITLVVIVLIQIPLFWAVWSSNYLFGFESKLANLTGFVGAMLMITGFVIGNRQIVRLFSKDLTWFLGVHKWLGIIGGFVALAHPILITLLLLKSFSFIFTPNFSNQFEIGVTYGRFALYFLILIWVSSSVLRGKIAFRPWSYIHFVSYPLVAFVWIHAWQVGSVLSEFTWMQYYWIGAGIVFVGIVILRLLQVFNFGYHKYKVSKISYLANNVSEIVVEPISSFALPKVGQFFYIKLQTFGESHPFTAMKFDESSGRITFGVKAIGKFSNNISKLKKNVEILLDGPYGVFTQEGQNNTPKVVVAGGVGVTPFVELIERYGRENTIMFNCNKKLDSIIYRDKFKEILNGNYHDVLSDEFVEGDNLHSAKIDSDIILQNVPNNIIKEAKYFICGPIGFMNSVVKTLGSIGVPRNQIFLEKFTH